jgi:hypothetical protein
MKPTIIKFYGVDSASLTLVDHELVIEAELAFWCARQVRAHLNVTVDVCP